jgi:hypothetical protein
VPFWEFLGLHETPWEGRLVGEAGLEPAKA